MSQATVDGVTVHYEVMGSGDRTWVLTPGARDAFDTPGLRELGQELVDQGATVLLWDRPNCGASDVCFTGPSESEMQADVLAGLLRSLGLPPALVAGGSGGSRVSLLTAARHPDVAAGVALWWISGGVLGSIALGTHYCSGSIRAVWEGGMEAVADLPEWQEVQQRNPGNRQRLLDQDPRVFKETMERWMLSYCPCGDDVVAGLSEAQARAFALPALVFRSGQSDHSHPREVSERVAAVLPGARLVEPPWGDREWRERQEARGTGGTRGLFVRWPLLAPQLQEWAESLEPGR